MVQETTALSGLEMARSLIGKGRPAGIAETLDFYLTEIEDGSAVCEGVPGAYALNPSGVVHGGYAATMLDTVCGFAVISRLPAGQASATIELKISYHRAMTSETGLIRAEGRIVTMGKRVAFTEARLIDRNGQLYASATSSLLISS